MEPRLLILAAALAFFVVTIVIFVVSVVRSTRKHEEFEPIQELGDWPALPPAPDRVLDTNLAGLDLDLAPDSPSAALLTPLRVGNWQPPAEPAPSSRLGEISLAQRIAAYQPAPAPQRPASPPPPQAPPAPPAPPAPEPAPQPAAVKPPAPTPAPQPTSTPQPTPTPQAPAAPTRTLQPTAKPQSAPAMPAPAVPPVATGLTAALAAVPLVVPEAVAPAPQALGAVSQAPVAESAPESVPLSPIQHSPAATVLHQSANQEIESVALPSRDHLMQAREVAPAAPSAPISVSTSMPTASELGESPIQPSSAFEWVSAPDAAAEPPLLVGPPVEQAEMTVQPVAQSASEPTTAQSPAVVERPAPAPPVPPAAAQEPAPAVEPTAALASSGQTPGVQVAEPERAPTLEPPAVAVAPPTSVVPVAPDAPAAVPAQVAAPEPALVPPASAERVPVAVQPPEPSAMEPASPPEPASAPRPTTVVRTVEAPAPVPSPAPEHTAGPTAEHAGRPRAHVRAPLDPTPTAEAEAAVSHVPPAQPTSSPAPGLRSQAPELIMVAPVEMWFGEARVGVKAGTRTYEQFRRYADVLLGGLKGEDPEAR